MNEKVREKLNLTKEQARELIDGNQEDFEIISEAISGQGRWDTRYRVIVKRKSDGKFFRDYFSRGSTEYQHKSPYEYTEPNFTEVFPVEKTVIVYE